MTAPPSPRGIVCRRASEASAYLQRATACDACSGPMGDAGAVLAQPVTDAGGRRGWQAMALCRACSERVSSSLQP